MIIARCKKENVRLHLGKKKMKIGWSLSAQKVLFIQRWKEGEKSSMQ